MKAPSNGTRKPINTSAKDGRRATHKSSAYAVTESCACTGKPKMVGDR
jgi:hypothetical protein